MNSAHNLWETFWFDKEYDKEIKLKTHIHMETPLLIKYYSLRVIIIIFLSANLEWNNPYT